ncbi:MAG: rhombosortase [Lentisphaeria bacterium]|nr:rhombosortase [Lentisphaeria bacterium]
MTRKTIPFVTLLLALPAVGLFIFPASSALFQYDRAAIFQGEFWRLITHHWTHWNADHLIWDLITFIGLGAVCELRDRRAFIRVITVTSLVISVALFTALGSLMTCRGLSGLDSALFGLLITRVYLDEGRRDRAVKHLCLAAAAFFFIKTLIETGAGVTLFVDSAQARMIPIPLSHLSGFISGCFLASPSALTIFRARMSPRGSRINAGRLPLKKEPGPVEAVQAS